MLKERLIQHLVKNLLVAVMEDDILRITSRGWFKGNRKLTEEEVTFLKDGAKEFSDSIIWQYMKNELRWVANLRMFEKGQVPENTIFGRAMLYNLEVMEKFLENCKKL